MFYVTVGSVVYIFVFCLCYEHDSVSLFCPRHGVGNSVLEGVYVYMSGYVFFHEYRNLEAKTKLRKV